MRRLFLASTLLLGCATFRADDRVAIGKVLTDQRDAWNRGDLDAFMSGYVPSDELVFTSGAKVRRGFDATRTRYRERYGKGGAMGQLAFSELEIHPVGPDAAWVLGHWELTQTPEAGRGIFTLVFVRQKGRWLIVHDHTSAAP